MTKKEIRAAYREFNRAARLRSNLDAADRLIAKLEADNRERTVRELTDRLQDDEAFLKAVRSFDGHTEYGWRCVCQRDGRMLRLLQNPGWKILKEVIRRVRWRRYASKPVGQQIAITIQVTP